ncbi:glycosyl transferase family 2 [Desulfovibrio sp. X2]|uniref:glycosyltransferase family 2 protein n=1 Tax=Desulfovibrio sp. X2 TaxID=941449 RepID=UPI000358A70B|nr:glycosyltransferase family 2 protein [Desulfovibrio sp. X2]EPR37112.1 glycosyl transferase family 2 [Desulfovibrio sp. X2]
MGTLRPLWRLALFRWRLRRARTRLGRATAGDASLARPADCPLPRLSANGSADDAAGRESGATSGGGIMDTGAPVVSVVIPCYNYGAFVLEAVDSVLAQTLQEIDITVVDGGSTDAATREVLARLDRPRTTVLFQSGPSLVGSNRNLGIAATRGRYVCCLDADDRLKPTYLEKAVALLEGCRFDVVSAGYEVLGRPESVLLNMPAPLLEDMLLGNHMLTCAVFSRALFARTGGFVDTGKGPEHVAEDWRLWVHMAALGARMRNIMEPLLEYRVHEAGASLSRLPGAPPKWRQARAIEAALKPLLTRQALARSRSRSGACPRCPR